jgi:hypothetical protein
MKSKQHTIETLKITSLILVLAGLLFAIAAWARASETEGSTQTDVNAMQAAPDSGGIQQSPDTGSYQERRAAREARRKASGDRIQRPPQEASQLKSVPVAVSVPAAALTGINVSFKLDPRIFSGNYGGERWVSPPTYTGASAQDTVETRVEGIDAMGQRVRISPKWTPADPEMVEVSPSEGNPVKITVKRAGESKLIVAAQGVSKELLIKAKPVATGIGMQVEISQEP